MASAGHGSNAAAILYSWGVCQVPSPSRQTARYIREASLIERFDAVLYPIDAIALLDRLPELGWLVARQFDDQGAITFRDTPSKGNARLRIDTGNKTLGVTSNDMGETLAVFKELRDFTRQQFHLPPGVTSDYVELRYIGWIVDGTTPVEVFSSWWSHSQRVLDLGRFLGQRLPSDAEMLIPYGIRFAPYGLDANRPNWAEITITPVAFGGHQRYHFDLIYRNEEFSKTEKVAEAADEIIDATLMQLHKRP